MGNGAAGDIAHAFQHVAVGNAGGGEGEVTVRGWVYRTRSSGKLAFVVIRDATGILQCTISQAKVPEGDFIAACKALRESSVIVTGTPAADDRANDRSSSN